MGGNRLAGLNERRCIARDILGLYGSIITLGTYTCEGVPNELFKGSIIKAVKECICRHPVLSTVILDADSEQPRLECVSRVDLQSHVRFEFITQDPNNPAVNLAALLERIHDESHPDMHLRPQWSLCVFRLSKSMGMTGSRFYAALATSHSLSDGMSGAVFHSTLLQSLQRVDEISHDSSWILERLPNEAELLPPLDRAGQFPISWRFLLAPLLEHLLPQSVARMLGVKSDDNNTWHGAQTRPQRPQGGILLPTFVHATILPEDLLTRVLAACRRERVRLTGLLNVLVARALHTALQSRGTSCYSFSVETAIDLRRCLPVAKGHMANYASAINQSVPVDGSHPISAQDWDNARRMTSGLAEAASSLRDQPVALLKYLNNYRDWVMQRASTPTSSSFSTSNLGVFDDGGNGKASGGSTWAIEEMLFSQSADATGAPFNMNIASAKGGSLAMVMTWWPGMLGVEDEKSFMAEVCQAVMGFLMTSCPE